MSTTKTVIIGLIALTFLRIIIGASAELSPDEAYYFLWAEHLAPSYYSKGPGIALAIKIATTLFGANELGVRIFSPLLALASSLVFLRLGRSLFDEQTAAWAAVLLNLIPIFNAGSVVFTIDPLSVFFWIAALFTFWRALHRAASWNLFWPLTGLLIGLGFLCKYTNAIQLLSIVLLLTLSRRWRGQLGRPGLYLLLLAFLLCTIPVIIWNWQNNWITLTHLVERGSLDESTGLHPLEFVEFTLMHLGVYSPLVFAGLIWALGRAVRRYPQDDSETYLLFFSLPIILLYFLLSLREAGEANWTVPGFIGVSPLLVHYWQDLQASNRFKHNMRSATLGLAGIMSVITLNTDVVRQAGLPWPYARDPSTRLRGWQESAAHLDEVLRAARDSLGEEVFVIGNKYQTAAILSFYLSKEAPLIRPHPDYPKIHIIESQAIQNQFSFWPRYDGLAPGEKAGTAKSPFLGKNAIYITDDAKRQNVPPNIRNAFENCELTGIVDIERFDRERYGVIRRFKIFTCYNYQSLPL